MARPRKPPRLHRRDENNVWEIVYFCDKAGRTVHRSLATENETEAREKFAEWLVRNRPYEADSKGLTALDVLTFYANYVRKECVAKDAALSSIKHLKAFFGAMPASSVTAVETKEYTKKRLADGIKPSTIRLELSKLRAAYSHAAKEGFGGLTYVPIFAKPDISEPKEDFIDTPEMQKVLDYLSANRDGGISDTEAFVVIAFRTAARRTSILQLTWDRVDFKRRLVDFQTPEWKALPRKRRSKRRAVVPMSDKLFAFLTELHAERQPEPSARIISFSVDVLYNRLERLSLDMGFTVAPHLLRRTFGSLASMSGKDTREISRIMGNTERVAEERYLRFNPDYLKNAVEID